MMTHSSSPNSDLDSRLASARAADNGSRHALLESHRNYLKLLARGRTDRNLRSKFSDSDLVQETLLQAHRDFQKFRGRTEAELAGRLRAIMSNKQALLARRFYGSPGRGRMLRFLCPLSPLLASLADHGSPINDSNHQPLATYHNSTTECTEPTEIWLRAE